MVTIIYKVIKVAEMWRKGLSTLVIEDQKRSCSRLKDNLVSIGKGSEIIQEYSVHLFDFHLKA